MIVLSYASGVPIERIEADFTTNPFYPVTAGDITGTADNTRFRLHSIYDIVSVAYPAFAPDPEAMDRFLLQIELGIPADALDLDNLPVRLNRAAFLSLRDAGIGTVDALLGSDPALLERYLPNETVQSLMPYLTPKVLSQALPELADFEPASQNWHGMSRRTGSGRPNAYRPLSRGRQG